MILDGEQVTMSLTYGALKELESLSADGHRFREMKKEVKVEYPTPKVQPSTPFGAVMSSGPRIVMTPAEMLALLKRYFL